MANLWPHSLKRLSVTLFVGVAMGSMALVLQAQPSPPKAKVPPLKLPDGRRSPFEPPPGQTLPSFDWTREPWTSSDKPYLALRSQIDRQIQSSKGQSEKLRVLVNRYEAVAKKQPLNAQSQFAWAYAAYEANPNGYPIKSGWGVPRALSLALASPSSPRSYQYARLRFLIGGWWRPMSELSGLGERLLKRNPQDYQSQFYLAKLLSVGSESQTRRAVQMAEQMVNRYPAKRSAHAVLADARWGLFLRTDKRQDGEAALAAGRKYLAMLPPSSPSRAESQSILKSIQEKLKR